MNEADTLDEYGQPRRLLSCIGEWPECAEGDYDPHCCRWPKSCSCTVYAAEHVTDADLEPPRRKPPMVPADDPRVDMLAQAGAGYTTWHRFSEEGRDEAREDARRLLARLDAAISPEAQR